MGELEVLCGFQAALTGRWDPGGFRWAAGGLTRRWVLSLCPPAPPDCQRCPLMGGWVPGVLDLGSSFPSVLLASILLLGRKLVDTEQPRTGVDRPCCGSSTCRRGFRPAEGCALWCLDPLSWRWFDGHVILPATLLVGRARWTGFRAWPGHPRPLGDVPEPRPLWEWGCGFHHGSTWGPTPAGRDPQGSRPRAVICLLTPFPQPESWRAARQGGRAGCLLHPNQRAAPSNRPCYQDSFRFTES